MRDTKLYNETKKTVYDMMSRVDTCLNNYHVGKDDFIGGLYDTSKPSKRVEAWLEYNRSGNMYIELYVGNETIMFSTVASVLSSESDILKSHMSVKHSKKELVIDFNSIRALDIFLSNYYKKEEKKEEKKATKKATANRKKSKTA